MMGPTTVTIVQRKGQLISARTVDWSITVQKNVKSNIGIVIDHSVHLLDT
jgi:hypothetical protein